MASRTVRFTIPPVGAGSEPAYIYLGEDKQRVFTRETFFFPTNDADLYRLVPDARLRGALIYVGSICGWWRWHWMLHRRPISWDIMADAHGWCWSNKVYISTAHRGSWSDVIGAVIAHEFSHAAEPRRKRTADVRAAGELLAFAVNLRAWDDLASCPYGRSYTAEMESIRRKAREGTLERQVRIWNRVTHV